MYNRQDVLRIVAEKHGLIVGDDDPILSVLSVSDVIYEQHTIRLLEQLNLLLAKASKVNAVQLNLIQTRGADAVQSLMNQNLRIIETMIQDTQASWKQTFGGEIDSIQKKLQEFKSIRNQIYFLVFGFSLILISLSFFLTTRGL